MILPPDELVQKALEDLGGALSCARGETEILVPRGRIHDVLHRLRDDPVLDFNQLIDICAVDWPARVARFEVVYQLLSLPRNCRLRVVTQTDEMTPLASSVDIYPAAGWFEREIFDLFGIAFDGHPDLRRILTDYGFEGYPLRRDFPLTGFTQMRYDALKGAVVAEPLSLQQDYRAFDAASPWRGMTDVQKRGEA